jgi:regulator of sigma D
MKKSPRNIKLKDLLEEASKLTTPKDNINPQDLINDANKIFSFVDKFENLDYENDNLEGLQKEIEKLGEDLKEKYKDIIEESEKNLDTEE